MINNNMKMIKGMDNIFSYTEYVAKCRELDIVPVSLQDFCDGIGRLKVGLEFFGKEDWQKSYISMYDEIARQQKVNDGIIVSQSNSKKSNCCGGKKKKSPNLIQKGLNLAKAAAEHIISGMKHVETKEFLRRLAICEGCTDRLEGFVCNKCGCYMGIKASWAEQKCGLNKW